MKTPTSFPRLASLINLAELVKNPPVAPALSVIAMNRRAALVAFSQADGSVYLYRRD